MCVCVLTRIFSHVPLPAASWAKTPANWAAWGWAFTGQGGAPECPAFFSCRCQASFCDARLPRRRVGANGEHVCRSPLVELRLIFRAPGLKSSVFSTALHCLRRSERRVSQLWAQPDPTALGICLLLGTTRAWAGWSAWLMARYRHNRQRTKVVGLSVGGLHRPHSALPVPLPGFLRCHPPWAPTSVWLKLPVISQGSHAYGLYFASRPAWASLPSSVHSLCRHQFRVRVTALIKTTASVCVHVSLLLTLNRPLFGAPSLPISENRDTDLVKISASPSRAPGLGFRCSVWTECMPVHSLQMCPRGQCSEQGKPREETGMVECPSLPPGGPSTSGKRAPSSPTVLVYY